MGLVRLIVAISDAMSEFDSLNLFQDRIMRICAKPIQKLRKSMKTYNYPKQISPPGGNPRLKICHSTTFLAVMLFVSCVSSVYFSSVLAEPGSATEQISVAFDGNTSTSKDSGEASTSADGRYVVFSSQMKTFVDPPTNGEYHIFVRDRLLGITTQESLDYNGNETANKSASNFPSISRDGQFVTFSTSSNLIVPGDTNYRNDIFLRDRVNGTIKRVSVDENGDPVGLWSYVSSVSGDGRFVVFLSVDVTKRYKVRNAAGSTEYKYKESPFLYVYDDQSGTSTLIPTDFNGTSCPTPGLSSDPTDAANGFYEDTTCLNSYLGNISISDDGRFVVFDTSNQDLVPNDTNNSSDIFVHDLQCPFGKGAKV